MRAAGLGLEARQYLAPHAEVLLDSVVERLPALGDVLPASPIKFPDVLLGNIDATL